ncbi:uncharacterized protein PG998_008993 [Apiospora kogelbergensis]|uniref:Uncharacterized protein n=1 Tax=Apiospora kogelbergensis TaxID=1337665 RepID=A0AAW0R6H6_9PEZI
MVLALTQWHIRLGDQAKEWKSTCAAGSDVHRRRELAEGKLRALSNKFAHLVHGQKHGDYDVQSHHPRVARRPRRLIAVSTRNYALQANWGKRNTRRTDVGLEESARRMVPVVFEQQARESKSAVQQSRAAIDAQLEMVAQGVQSSNCQGSVFLAVFGDTVEVKKKAYAWFVVIARDLVENRAWEWK